MSGWTSEELERIAQSDDLHVSPYRDDGVTPGTPTWIWAVVVDGAVYARAYNGLRSRWHQAALQQGSGQVTVAGMTRTVTFEPVDEGIQPQIDDAYRIRYAGSPYLGHMTGAVARAATLQIQPRPDQA